MFKIIALEEEINLSAIESDALSRLSINDIATDDEMEIETPPPPPPPPPTPPPKRYRRKTLKYGLSDTD